MNPPFSSAAVSPIVLLLLLISSSLSLTPPQHPDHASAVRPMSSSPFSSTLATLQKDIGYEFKTLGLLRRAMTHSSYSMDNYRTLSVLGLHSLQASVALACFQDDPGLSPADFSRHVETATTTDSCVADGDRLGIGAVVRVSPKTNSSAPAVVCGAFRAIFGAIAVDSGNIGSAGEVFRRVHRFQRHAVVSDI